MVALASTATKTARRIFRAVAPHVVIAGPVALMTPQPFRFTVQDYYRLGKLGILKPDDRVELIEGEIVMMPPTDPDHANGTDNTEKKIYSELTPHFKVRCQQPVRLDDKSEPVPDISVVKMQSYKGRHPAAADTLLIVEVSNSSLKEDLERKRLMYAKAGIPEYWVLDLNGQSLHIFTKPRRGDYAETKRLEAGETVKASGIRSLKVKVRDLLP